VSLIRTSTRVIAAAVVFGAAAGLPTGAAPAHAQPGRAQATTEPALQTIGLTPGLARTAAPATHDTHPFSLLGATWANPRTALGGTVEVRTRAAGDGRWGAWRALESDEPGEPGGRGSTDPLWVGESTAVQARVASTGGPLPAGLRLDLINPGADRPQPRVAGTGTERPIPTMVSRARWDADEAIVKHAPEYTTDVQVMFVHHTATGNGYSCGQSASIIRGIEMYHVRSKGWNDIGYNFLVDKCGTLFEGRKGGVNLPVLGAHTLGFNSHSSAIAVIGDYSGGGVSPAVRAVIAQVAAYKIGTYGNIPSGTVVLTSNGSDRYPIGTRVALNRISGHRDTGRTECPGNALYAQLPAIRALAGQAPKGLAVLRMTGAERFGSIYYTRGTVSPLWTLTTPSAAIDHFEVLVDGVLRETVTGASRTVALHLAAGRHAVTVRAFHLNGITAKAVAEVIVDRDAPAFTAAPGITLRRGSLRSAVPVRLGYAVTDANGVRAVTLTSPSVADLGIVPRTWAGYTPLGVAATWTVRALDWAGNTTSASVTRTPVLMTEAEADRTGSWRALADPAYLGGRAVISTTAGSRLTWTFRGPSAQLAVARTPTSGRLHVYLDGADAGLVDLRAPGVAFRDAVIAPSWSGDGPHTLSVVAEATAGRPSVIIDGLVRLD
jgi:N-acetylmuramoyl-L-alanine amidase-like protein